MIGGDAAPGRQRSAQIAVRTLGTTAVVIAGVASLGSTLIGIVASHAGPVSWSLLALTGVLWLAGFTVRNRELGALASISALVLLYAGPLITDEAWAWMSFGVMSSCIAVSAAIALAPRFSVPVLAVTFALMCAYAAFAPVAGGVDMHLPVVEGWAAPLFNLSVAAGIALWRAEWVRAARQSDEALAHAIGLQAASQRAIAVSEARVTVARSLHETVLNTLVAVAAGTSATSVPELRRVCRDDLERARIESSEDAVIVRPQRAPLPPALTRSTPAVVLLTGQRRLRLAASSAMLFGILTVGFVVDTLPIPLALLAPYVAFVAVIGALVWWWRLQRTLAAIAFLLLSVMALVSATIETQGGFVDEGGRALDWVINVGASSMILPTLAIAAGAVVRIVFPWTLLAANIVAITLLPPDERSGPIISLVVTSLFLGGMAGAAIWLFGRIDRQDVQARALLAEASDAEYAQVHRAELLAAWAAVSRATQDLLAGIGSGRLDPADATVQERAQTEATILRSHLRMARSPSSGMQASLEHLLRAASEAGTPVDVTIIVPSRTATGLPEPVAASLTRLIESCPGRGIAIRLVGGGDADPDELIIAAPADAGRALVDGFPTGLAASGWRAALEDETGASARISISCHEFATADS